MEFLSPPPFLSDEIIQMFDEDLIPIKSPSEYAFKEADHECLANSTNEVRFLTSISPNVDIRYEELEEGNRISSPTPKKRRKNPESWKCNIRKKLRESGKDYININNTKMPARKIKPACYNCFLKCAYIFSKEDRMNLHQSFWNMSDDEKNNFYIKFVARHPVVRRRTLKSAKKEFSFLYYLEKDKITYRVCRTFF
ncbi:uncharacterized protein LOC124421344 isoform X1 [Lucilia cuprina]|uniref:uncharacterized protein LOC124421344 isoform X1 n=2 Tax=Lucilia cuprina TaxID=7375 RepID=UPI001F06C491|nr:uncharacterized protein LOC124421344 isoform X1 [Lucilia cuprina]